MGSVICGTMLPKDLIPAFTSELDSLVKHKIPNFPIVESKVRKAHRQLVRDAESWMAEATQSEEETGIEGWELDEIGEDYLEDLYNALDCYAGPYFYFGAHPGDGADHGWWLSEDWEELLKEDGGIKVNNWDLVPKGFVGLIAVVNDHGNVSLLNKPPHHKAIEIWSVV